MLVVIVIAVIVVLVAVVLVAMGHGGQLSVERGDYAPLDLGPVSATDVALLRPPSGLWGYNMQATDEAMERIALSVRERDVRIAALEQLVSDLSRDRAPALPLGGPYAAARHRRASSDTAQTAREPATQTVQIVETEPALWPVESEAPMQAQAAESGQPDGTEPARWHIESAPLGGEPAKSSTDASAPPPEQSHE